MLTRCGVRWAKRAAKAAAAAAPREAAATAALARPKVRAMDQKYRSLTQREHVLQRPDMYVGSAKSVPQHRWVLNWAHGAWMLEFTKTETVPGLIKIVDELLVNVSDNYHRTKGTPRETNKLDVVIDRKTGEIRIRNNGAVIDVAWHKTGQCYVPELVFGRFQSGSNFDDDSVRITGGRNGIGAKAANVLSKHFAVKIVDAVNGHTYSQAWRNSMKTVTQPVLRGVKGKTEESMEVSLLPDYSYFSLPNGIDDDHYGVLSARVADLAACCPGLKVTLNGQAIPWNSLEGLVREMAQASPGKVTCEEGEFQVHRVSITDSETNLPWEVIVTPKLHCKNMSYANAVATVGGGTHLTAVMNSVHAHVRGSVEKLLKVEATDQLIKNHVSVFVSAVVGSPEFCGQSKDRLLFPKLEVLQKTVTLPPSFLEGVVDDPAIMQPIRDKLMGAAKSISRKKKLDAPIRKKLYDARKAGGSQSLDCTLIVTEGESAKSLALAGVDSLGRDHWGVYSLRGKIENPRKNGKEKNCKSGVVLSDLERILGLVKGRQYTTDLELATLRYGSVTLMCDQDHDGHHIKGLFLNWLSYHWPNLMEKGVPMTVMGTRRAGAEPFATTAALPHREANAESAAPRAAYLRCISTPLVKALPVKKKSKEEEVWFFSSEEMNAWAEKRKEDETLSRYMFRYYKGLGSSSSDEGREYLTRVAAGAPKMLTRYDRTEGEDKDSLELAFGGGDTSALLRRTWLRGNSNQRSTEGGGLTDTAEAYASASRVTDFVHSELACSFKYFNKRTLPSCIDGLKLSQRKVLHTCFERQLFAPKELKVVQLSGAVAELTQYHHGEQSLHMAIIKLAQDFVGCGNNVPLLEGLGQFGSRLAGGSDHASPRYISTRLSPLTRLLFRAEDDAILPRTFEDGAAVEPEEYVPVLPLLLVNSTVGIGTGFATNTRPCDPLALVALLYRLLECRESEELEWLRKKLTKRHGLHVKVLEEQEELRKVREAADRAAEVMWPIEKPEYLERVAQAMERQKTEKAKVGKAKKKPGAKKSAVTIEQEAFKMFQKDFLSKNTHTERVEEQLKEAQMNLDIDTENLAKLVSKKLGPVALLRPWYEGHTYNPLRDGPSGKDTKPPRDGPSGNDTTESNGVWTTTSLRSGKDGKMRYKMRITELPAGVWTEDFVNRLENFNIKDLDYKNDSTDRTVLFDITATKPAVEKVKKMLRRKISSAWTVLDGGEVESYIDGLDVLVRHYDRRYDLYSKRLKGDEERAKAQVTSAEIHLAVVKELRADPKLLTRPRGVIEEALVKRLAGKGLAGKAGVKAVLPTLSLTSLGDEALEARRATLKGRAKHLEDVKKGDAKDLWRKELLEFAVAYVRHTGPSLKDVKDRLLEGTPAALTEKLLSVAVADEATLAPWEKAQAKKTKKPKAKVSTTTTMRAAAA